MTISDERPVLSASGIPLRWLLAAHGVKVPGGDALLPSFFLLFCALTLSV